MENKWKSSKYGNKGVVARKEPFVYQNSPSVEIDQANDLTFSPIGVDRQGFDSALLQSNCCDVERIVMCDDEADSLSRSKNAQI